MLNGINMNKQKYAYSILGWECNSWAKVIDRKKEADLYACASRGNSASVTILIAEKGKTLTINVIRLTL